jgi:hypothetical protein
VAATAEIAGKSEHLRTRFLSSRGAFGLPSMQGLTSRYKA